MVNLQNKLTTTPRENSGSSSSNRFDYQKNWVLCKLLELQSNQSDYLIILDLHEDVIILDSSKKPKKASFFQIKTKASGHWTLNQLIRRKKQKDGIVSFNKRNLSILGKLYYNKIVFDENTNDLNFVSNKYCKMKFKDNTESDGKQRMICVNELCDSDKNKILDKLSKELEISKNEIAEDIIFFVLSSLEINTHTETTKGKLADFLDKEMQGCKYKLGIVYTTIFDEIRTKTNQELRCKTFNELLKFKSISKKNFDEMLTTILSSFSEDTWSEVSTNLIQDGFSLSDRRKIRTEWNRYSIEIMDTTNILLNRLRKKIRETLSKLEGKEIKNCIQLLTEVLCQYQKIKLREAYEKNNTNTGSRDFNS